MIDQKLLGNRIKSLRIQKGLSQEKLGELAGLNGKYFGEVERGNSNISITNLSKLADVLEVPFLSLLTLEHEQDRSELVKELHKMIDAAGDTQLKTIYRILEAVLR
ncbi:MAG: helix-turn-helix domain-containing protein [Desulfovibrio sp.]|jgi:transcriptional regulator with XRE-family HTH domain|nr:helix-turn-helix domain-containing protein [Desulfovibrio sp.]